MDWNRLVAIWFIGKRKKVLSFGTGYLIAPDRILTAAHILKPNWSRIVVCFVGVGTKEKHQCELTQPTADDPPVIVYDGLQGRSEGLDALIIRCKDSPPTPGMVPLLREPPKSPAEWYSNCFPEFAIGNEPPTDENYFDARGEFNSPSPNVVKFMVKCEETKHVPTAWRGISGSPLLLKTPLAEVAGVIVEVKLGTTIPSSDGKSVAPLERLRVVPTWKLLEDPAFREALGGVTCDELKESDEQWKGWLAKTVRGELRNLLEPEVAELFEDILELPFHDERASMEAISRDLVQDPEKVYRISEMRRECRKRGWQSAAGILENIENLLLPCLFPPEERERFWNVLKYGGAILIEHAATSSLAAEGRMANHDGRRMEVWKDDSIADKKEWRGERALQLGVVKPVKTTPEDTAFQLLLQLAGQALVAEQLPVTEEVMNDFLAGRASDKAFDDVKQHAGELALRLATALDSRSRMETRFFTPYCVVRIPDTGLSQELFRKALGILRSWVPTIEFLEISRHSEFGHHETPLLTLLKDRVEE